MSLMKYQPWSMFDQLHREINDLFDKRLTNEQGDNFLSSSNWQPAVDIKETDNEYLIKADIPGVKPEEIEVSTDNGRLSIKGERKQDVDETRGGVHRIECSYGSFFRSFTLPENVNAEAITAKADNGVLELTLPKTEEQQSRKIKIS